MPKKNECLNDLYIDSLSNVFLYCKDSKLYQYLLLFKRDEKLEKPSLEGTRNESSYIISTIKVDDDYTHVSPPFPFDLTKEYFEKDTANYLLALHMLKEMASNYKSPNDQWMYLQAALTYNAFVSNNPEYDRLADQFYQKKSDPDKQLNIFAFDSAAMNYMKERCANEQVVMINEQHWQPKHRFLGNLLLNDFYDHGFRYLAVEAIDVEDEEALNQRKYPLQETGFYTKEPQLSNMIRNALQMGYKIIAYDSFTGNREYNQAFNIYDKTISHDPNAKVLVWAGVQHIDERISGKPKMASYFKEISTIDPYTIEQTQGDFYTAFLKHDLAIDADTTQSWKCDLFIYNNLQEPHYKVNPQEQDTTWLIKLKPNIIKKIEQHKQLILSVFYKSEFDVSHLNSIPVLNRIVQDDADISLSLPMNHKFTVIFRTPTGFLIDASELN